MKNAFQILIVEDNPADAHLMRQLLRGYELPCEITTLTDGDQAIRFLRRDGEFAAAPRPSLIFLDLNLPRVDGREVLRYVKSDAELKKIPVLVFSTSTSPKDISDSYAMGANAFLAKPNGLEQMDELLKQTAVFWMKTAILGDQLTDRPR